jgi:hypothetical protein
MEYGDRFHRRIDRDEIISFNPLQSDTMHIERGICVRRDDANIPKIFIGGYIGDPYIKSSYKERYNHIDLTMNQFQHVIDSKEVIIKQISRGITFPPSQLGENSSIYYQVTLYNGRMLVHIRKWIKCQPKKEGVALTFNDFLRLLSLESEIKLRFERLICEVPQEAGDDNQAMKFAAYFSSLTADDVSNSTPQSCEPSLNHLRGEKSKPSMFYKDDMVEDYQSRSCYKPDGLDYTDLIKAANNTMTTSM